MSVTITSPSIEVQVSLKPKYVSLTVNLHSFLLFLSTARTLKVKYIKLDWYQISDCRHKFKINLQVFYFKYESKKL